MAGSLAELARVQPFDASQFIQAGEQGRRVATLADLGRFASQGDYRDAAGAAFAGGQADIGAQLANMTVQQHQVLVQDAASLAQSADTPQKWEQAGKQFEAAHPGVAWAPFEQRGAVISQALTAQDQIANRLKEQEIGVQGLQAKAAYLPYQMMGMDVGGMGGGGGDVSPGGAPVPGAAQPGQPTLQQAAQLVADGQAGPTAQAGAQPPPQAPTPAPDAAGGRDEAFLSTLPPQMQALVKGIADYKLPLNQVTSIRGNIRSMVAAAVAKYDPSVDLTNYANHQRMKIAFGSGTQGQALASINAALEHLGQLQDAYGQIGNTNQPWLNRISNAFKEQTGQANSSGFDTIKQGVATEIAKALRGSGAMSESEKDEWLAKFDRNMSPDQFKASIQSALGLLAARSGNFNEQYQTNVGANMPAFLSSTAIKALQQFGVDPTDFDPSYQPPAAPQGAPAGAPSAPGGDDIDALIAKYAQ
jgi:hypothetical protein